VISQSVCQFSHSQMVDVSHIGRKQRENEEQQRMNKKIMRSRTKGKREIEIKVITEELWFYSIQGQEVFSPPNRPDRLWGSSSLLRCV